MDYNARLSASIIVTLNLIPFSAVQAYRYDAPGIFISGMMWTAIAVLFLWLRFKGKK